MSFTVFLIWPSKINSLFGRRIFTYLSHTKSTVESQLNFFFPICNYQSAFISQKLNSKLVIERKITHPNNHFRESIYLSLKKKKKL